MKMCLNLLVQKRVNSGTKSGLKRGSVASAIKKTLMLPQEPTNFLAYSVSYWAYHSNKATSERRCKDLLYKRFTLGATISPSLQWWYTQIDAGNYSGSTRYHIMDIADRILGDLPRSDKYPSKSRLRMLGAAFNLPEIIQNALDKYKESIDEPLRHGSTPLLVAIQHGSPDSVKYLLDRGANPHLISTAHRHHIKYYNMGMPIADEDMVYWVIAKGGNPQENLEERLQIEEILLSHECSRQAFIEQLERHLEKDTHSEPLRALETLYRAADGTPLPAKILERRIKDKGLGELADVLYQIDEETFNDKMVLGVIRFDSYETVEKLFELKQIDTITEEMIRYALKSSDSRTLAHFMNQSDSSLLRRELVIDEEPKQEDMWKVILDVKGKDFVDQEVFDSLFVRPDAKSVEYILHSCGIEMINSSHIDSIARLARSESSVDTLNVIIRLRGSLDGLITEEAVLSALKSGSSELYNLMLDNVEDQSILTATAGKLAGKRR
ncbi:10c3ebcd-7a31-43c3-b46b-f1ef18294bfa [Sclerotinia trifoliorum]|uniref:10c3ebcd-7a31-43c3-b46b-f1ef18294bfa n=1 Tax=Sclerotinia trifoliorum TaxID=28548 RepID=A0A8H2ZLH0_9HELO|nr:10c3ebcd-7a31-43c3-b46b-f1ef18294bfa [Sclerotinia trifoliorum]